MKSLKEFILIFADTHKQFTSKQIIDNYERTLSRQRVNQVINELIKTKQLIKGGGTRGAFYTLPKNAELVTAHSKVQLRLNNKDLKEHEILEDIKDRALFFPKVKRNVQDIFNYSFSEMLNNAIEHSHSKNIEVTLRKHKNRLIFTVSDVGIGVFKSIMTKKRLESELDAIRELLKGKTTTAPQAHSGEGIFFTSKMAEVFILDSFGYRLRIDNLVRDVFIEVQKPAKKGTRVIFEINLRTSRHTSEIFKRYVTDPETLAFDKTEIQIKLYTMGTIHVSRSQARRLLSGLNKFKKVILDFDQVPTIGQGFADEIFRVFQSRHPEITIRPINTNEAVDFMIGRVEKPQTSLPDK